MLKLHEHKTVLADDQIRSALGWRIGKLTRFPSVRLPGKPILCLFARFERHVRIPVALFNAV